jgi:hypothetical protein
MTATDDDARIRAEVRELQKATAVLACIQCAAEYDNETEADLADAVAVVRAIVTAVSARIDATFSKNGGRKLRVRGRIGGGQ